jgi:hypothetical protein
VTGYTPTNRLPYPDDYQQPADTPAAMQALAGATETALNGLLGRVGTAETNIGHHGNRLTALEGRMVARAGRAHINAEAIIDMGYGFPQPPTVTLTATVNDAASVPVILQLTDVGVSSFGVKLFTIQGGPNVGWVHWVAVGPA